MVESEKAQSGRTLATTVLLTVAHAKSQMVKERNVNATLLEKNSTNLITHLRTAHSEAYVQFSKKNEALKTTKPEQQLSQQVPSTSSGKPVATGGGGGIKAFLTVPKVWPVLKLMQKESSASVAT